ncbi:MAG TPA: L,D-transpeptidase [Rhizomicrobium sp.]|jgi:lipoprotein-anchoring transpeptidase ErfK/SrfK|nr:L,D-transpeptidase [Rhizomicrobium sp.]
MLKELAAATLVTGIAFSGIAAFAPKQAATPTVHTQIITFKLRDPLPAPKPIKMIKVLVAEPRRTPAKPRTIARAVSKPHLPANAVAATPLPPQAVAPQTTADEAGRVATRLASKIPDALTPYFDTFIYVSKAAHGPWAQHLFLFHKSADGTLAFEQSFAVSTGRERSEQYFTATPTGLFELDIHRFFPMARSAKWNDARMPWAMFLNYSYRQKMAGVALHAAIGAHELSDIGHRASGGCVRLPLAKANLLYHRFLKEELGQVPVFTFDDARGTTNTAGIVTHDDKGDIVLADGLRVLVVIDNYAGSGASPTQS